MDQTRYSSGCALSFDDGELYVFGGQDGINVAGTDTIDTYTVSTNAWTNNQNSVSAAALPQVLWNVNCVANVYDESIICPGGIGQMSTDSVSIYRTQTQSIVDEVTLITGTSSYGIAMYEFVNDGNDEASILFVTGGHNGGTNVYDSIQYMVLYNFPTMAPTMSPTTSPSSSPSNSPTTAPLADPTNAPTQIPTNIPTNNPTVFPTEEYGEGIAPEKVPEIYGTDPGGASCFDLLYATLIGMVVCFLLN